MLELLDLVNGILDGDLWPNWAFEVTIKGMGDCIPTSFRGLGRVGRRLNKKSATSVTFFLSFFLLLRAAGDGGSVEVKCTRALGMTDKIEVE